MKKNKSLQNLSFYRYYKSMKIKAQIVSGFLFILLLTCILAGVTIYYLSNLGAVSNRILEDNYRSIKATEGIVVSLSKIDQLLSKICLGSNYNDSTLLKILNNEQEVLENQLVICRNNLEGKEENKLFAQIESGYVDYQKNIALFEATGDRVGLYFSVLQRLNEVVRENSVQLASINHLQLSEEDAIAQNLYLRSKIYVFLIVMLVLVIVGWALYQVPHEIVKPITDITEKIERIAKGEYQQEIDVDSRSELGDLARAFNTMSVKLQEFEKLNIEEVQTQKSRMESIIRSMNDGLIILDEQEKIILVNDSSTQILSLDEEQLVGKKLTALEENSKVIRELSNSLRHDTADSGKRSKDMEAERHSFLKVDRGEGKKSFYTKEIVKVYGDEVQKRFIGYIIILKDITTFKESNDAKSKFIAVVSHELKTPLSALNMSLMLLRDSRFGVLSSEQDKIAASMKQEVHRLVNMVTELLDLSKVESGKINLEKKSVSPAVLMEYAVAPVQAKFEEKNIEIVKHIDPYMPDIRVDPEKVSWVLINLMTNAIRYSPENGKVILETRQLEDEIEFLVWDFGPGIPREDIKRVFNKFVQLSINGSKNKNGLGLGLAISKEVVEAHGGTISVESEPGRGSKFFFRIPVEPIISEANLPILEKAVV